MSEPSTDPSRRAFVKRAAYVAPAVLSLSAVPSYAKAGSVKPEDGGQVPQPRGDDPRNWNPRYEDNQRRHSWLYELISRLMRWQ